MESRRRPIGRYGCTDADGRHYTVIEYQNERLWEPLSGQAEWVPTTREHFLSTGEDVDMVDDKTFQIVGSEITLKRAS